MTVPLSRHHTVPDPGPSGMQVTAQSGGRSGTGPAIQEPGATSADADLGMLAQSHQFGSVEATPTTPARLGRVGRFDASGIGSGLDRHVSLRHLPPGLVGAVEASRVVLVGRAHQ